MGIGLGWHDRLRLRCAKKEIDAAAQQITTKGLTRSAFSIMLLAASTVLGYCLFAGGLATASVAGQEEEVSRPVPSDCVAFLKMKNATLVKPVGPKWAEERLAHKFEFSDKATTAMQH